jgi:hypothetical protein
MTAAPVDLARALAEASVVPRVTLTPAEAAAALGTSRDFSTSTYGRSCVSFAVAGSCSCPSENSRRG